MEDGGFSSIVLIFWYRLGGFGLVRLYTYDFFLETLLFTRAIDAASVLDLLERRIGRRQG
jgi:hypothetical protein